jgi:hypothetical protein
MSEDTWDEEATRLSVWLHRTTAIMLSLCGPRYKRDRACSSCGPVLLFRDYAQSNRVIVQ